MTKDEVNILGSTLEELIDLVKLLVLEDFFLMGLAFTFFSNEQARVCSCLDPLVRDCVTRWAKKVVQKVIFKLIVDHILVILTAGKFSLVYAPFTFLMFNVMPQLFRTSLKCSGIMDN